MVAIIDVGTVKCKSSSQAHAYKAMVVGVMI